MATYKGIRLPDRVAPLARHMPAVDDHREALVALSGTWDTLALLAHLSSLEADLSEVRASFGELTSDLLACLAEQALAQAEDALGRRAQAAVDLFTRRLARRGADVGLLAAEAQREATGILERLATDDEVLAILEGDGRVVASNDSARLPPGHRPGLRAGAAALRLGGVTHVAARRSAPLSRGDAGPGWSAVAFAPVELAFDDDAHEAPQVDFSGANVLPPRLLEMPVRAREIQRRLDRMVWNGRIHQAAESNAFSRSLLEAIAATGRKTRAQFERASLQLLASVAARLLRETRFLSRLAVDALDHDLPAPAGETSRVLASDSTPELAAALRASLPSTAGSVAAFCRRDGTVIDRTGELPVTLPTQLLSLAPGQQWSGVLAEGRQRFIVGAAASSGGEPVVGVVVIPCGDAADPHAAAVPQIADVAGGAEIATFLIGDQLLGVPAGDVVECMAVTAAVRVWRGGFAQRHVGFVTWRDMALPLVDIGADVNAPGAAQHHALVLKAGAQVFGLLVSELGPIASMQLTEERGLAGKGDATRLIAQLARSGPVILPVLSSDAIFGGPAA